MTASDPPVEQPPAHAAANTPHNTLRPSVTLYGALLWPAFRDPDAATPAAQIAQTGTILNHWHYTPGQLNAPPTAPAWKTVEKLTEAQYPYDRRYPGLPMANVDVDLFRADVGVDLDDYAAFREFYARDEQHVPRAKTLTIRFATVDVINDEDAAGKGELVFKGKIDGKEVGQTAELDAGSGQRNVALAWRDAGGSFEVDVSSRSKPIALELSGVDKDVTGDDSLGSIAAQIKPPWPTTMAGGSAATADFVAYWEIAPTLMSEEERANTAPPAESPTPDQKLIDGFVGTRTTDSDGRFAFGGLRAGDYLLTARGRLSFVQVDCPGGEVPMSPTVQHNAVSTQQINDEHGDHRLFVKVRVSEGGTFQFLAKRGGAEGIFNTDRLLPPGRTLGDIAADTPFRFYALPMVVKSNAAQWTACAEELGRALAVSIDEAKRAMGACAILDLRHLERFELADAPPEVLGINPFEDLPPEVRRPRAPRRSIMADDAALEGLLQRTLLLGGPKHDQRTVAFDHAIWCFREQSDTEKRRSPFVPLDTAAFFTGASPLYAAVKRTRDSYGRFALRYTEPALVGRDVRELKVRLILWGTDDHFVDLTNRKFDEALRDALIRFKRNRELFRRRVTAAGGAVDDAQSTVTSIVDAATYLALDAARPTLRLNDVCAEEDPRHPGTKMKVADGGIRLLAEQGYNRILFYAAEVARRRLAPGNDIQSHSAFRTLAYNRILYLDESRQDQPVHHELRWRLSSDAGPINVSHHGFNTTVRGVLGADGTKHDAEHQIKKMKEVKLLEPRGTYWGEAGARFAADYSNHTTGHAIDFELGRKGNVDRVQWDTNALRLFGAIRYAQAKGRLWLEPPKSDAFPTGTTDWIHIELSPEQFDVPVAERGDEDAPVPLVEAALTDEDIAGPRWDATVVVRGRVMRNGDPRLGARVELLAESGTVVTTYSDHDGRFSLRARGVSALAGYAVRVRYSADYPYQPVPATFDEVVPVFSPAIPLEIPWPGAEVALPDIVLPP